mgnify:CR=1 FL=1
MTQTRADRSADLTSGPMLQKIILFSIPLAASSILQLLFNAADVVVVGRFAGSTALAAVGSNGSLINLLVNLFVGLSLGANVVAARCFGAKDEHGVQDTVHTARDAGPLPAAYCWPWWAFCRPRPVGAHELPGGRDRPFRAVPQNLFHRHAHEHAVQLQQRSAAGRGRTPSVRCTVWRRPVSSMWC